MSVRDLISMLGSGGDTKDPNFKNVTLLLKGDTSNPDLTYNAFSDASSNAFPITSNGDAYGSAFSPYNTSWSNYFDGSGDYLSVANNAALDFGSGDFTVEFFVFVSSIKEQFFYARTTSAGAGLVCGMNSSGNYRFEFSTNGTSNTVITSSIVGTVNKWTHIALVRSGGTVTAWVDGASVGTASISGSLHNPSTSGYIGIAWPGLAYKPMEGYLSNMRLVKGTAVYTSNFTPSTAPLTAISGTSLLTCQSNRLIDNSSNNFAITRNGDVAVKSFSPFTDTDTTTGSGYFDGTGDYLSVPDNAVFDLPVGTNWTIESWFYKTATGAGAIIASNTYPAGQTNFSVGVNSSNQYQFYWVKSPGESGGDVFGIASSSTVALNQWNHVAAVNSGGTVTLYVNGSSVGTVALSGTFVNRSTGIGIGSYSADGASLPFTGYISNSRIVVGTAVYTSNFTPPTSSLEAITNTKLLTLQTRGATQNIGIIDSSPNRFPITRVGNTTQGTFSPYGSLWSNYFDGSGDYLDLPSNAAFDPGTSGEWSIECFVYCTGDGAVLGTFGGGSNPTNGWDILFGSEKFYFRYWYPQGTYFDSGGTAASKNTWNHVAVCRNSTRMSMFLNGNRVWTTTTNLAISSPSNTFKIGKNNNTADTAMAGYISNVRLLKGSTAYDPTATTITVPTAPITAITNTQLLTCQSNRFIDNSSNNFAITVNGDTKVTRFSPFNPTAPYSANTLGGSGYFDGTGDYLSVPDNTAWYFTGDYTVECWAYWTSTSASEANLIAQSRPADSTNQSIDIYSNGTTLYYVYNSGNASTTITANQWYHIAMSCTSGTVSCYLNGTRVGTFAMPSRVNATDPLTIGVRTGSGGSGVTGYFTGYLSNIRVVNGTGIYSGTTITVPTAPLTAITNTSLLCNFTNAGIPDAAMMNDLETVGNAQVSTSVKKYGTGSLAFDGTGDYLVSKTATTDLYAFGTGDFTIEFWAWYSALPPQNYAFIDFSQNVSGAYPTIYLTGAGNLIYFTNGGNRIVGALAGTSTWHHIAVTRSGTSTKLFANGVQIGSTYSDSTNYSCFAGRPYIGIFSDLTYPFNGYIDDLRITKGVARYTANFTPPAQALPTN